MDGRVGRFEETPVQRSADKQRREVAPHMTPSFTPTASAHSTPKASKLFSPSPFTPATGGGGAKKPLPPTPRERERDMDEAPVEASTQAEGVLEKGKHEHNSLEWLKDRRDSKGRRPDHPDFDPRTLWVCPRFMQAQTPAQKQWWEFKSKFFDTILFFRVSCRAAEVLPAYLGCAFGGLHLCMPHHWCAASLMEERH
jgi:hypothetical protein